MLAPFAPHRFWSGGLVVAVIAATASPALACDVILADAPSEVRIDYDPFEPSRSISPASFSVESRTDETCSIDIAIVGLGGLPMDEAMIADSGVRIRFQSGASGTPLAMTGTAGVWRAEIQPDKRYRIAFAIQVILDSVAPAGTHVERFSVELRDAGALTPLHAPAPLSLKLASKPRAQMNISGGAGSFGQGGTISRVDFGDLVTNSEKHIFLQVRSNTQARLTIASENLGLLKREEASGPTDGISYQAFLSGKEVDLKQVAQIMLAPPLNMAGTSLPFDLRIGTVGARAAGTYSDHLTINISPL